MSDIFISHASKDFDQADRIRAKLEEKGLECWIAPRDIAPGMPYPEAIMQGLKQSPYMIVLLTPNANDSKFVLREVEFAISKNKRVFPLKFEEIPLAPSFSFFLDLVQHRQINQSNLNSTLDQITEIVQTNDLIEYKKSWVPPQPKIKPWMKKTALAAAIVIAAIPAVDYIQNFMSSPAIEKPNPLQPYLQDPKISAQEKAQLSAVNHLQKLIPASNISVSGWSVPQKALFIEGDEIQLKAMIEEEAYVIVFVHTMDGNTYLIHPNHFDNLAISAKEEIFTIGNHRDFMLQISEPFGKDVVHFIACSDKATLESLLQNFPLLKDSPVNKIERPLLEVKLKQLMQELKESGSAEDIHWGQNLLILKTEPKTS